MHSILGLNQVRSVVICIPSNRSQVPLRCAPGGPKNSLSLKQLGAADPALHQGALTHYANWMQITTDLTECRAGLLCNGLTKKLPDPSNSMIWRIHCFFQSS